jgi:hypothetical protein
MGLAARSQSHNALSAGAIAGVVLGTIAVVALLAIASVLAYFVWQRRIKKPYSRKHSKTDITPFRSFSDSSSTHSLGDHYRGQQQNGNLSPRAGLLDAGSNPTSPDWRTTLISRDTNTNTFAGGTTFGDELRNSQVYYRTEMHTSTSGLIELDSPPPYPIPHSPPPVPLVPLRKGRRQ